MCNDTLVVNDSTLIVMLEIVDSTLIVMLEIVDSTLIVMLEIVDSTLIVMLEIVDSTLIVMLEIELTVVMLEIHVADSMLIVWERIHVPKLRSFVRTHSSGGYTCFVPQTNYSEVGCSNHTATWKTQYYSHTHIQLQ